MQMIYDFAFGREDMFGRRNKAAADGLLHESLHIEHIHE
eukprot:CAMPEP_0197625088 /NCGR_PEP_ID=MMETSP1338-20131121/4541_1 /TAXON_ID=43686 ORGANISM="Pelagodinium beii, Strain RCC1491" /NCGR_SAMPLE_ID=MMETSP1338 /ASSEMBLY_ACC=CAM_ASM_000754 /LENGTH=38 /DNA_ID= /DNA_START= /DNA_END= /DNA_ORIENTATION=